jgi:acyl-CoA synthetase (AMP-forming)/AMP-acid ligase II
MKLSVSNCFTLTEILEFRAEHSPEAVAIIVEGKSYTYKWLWEKCRNYGAFLMTENVKKKDRIIVMVPNSAGFFIAFYGSILCGAIAVPVFPNAGTGRCQQLARLSGSRHIIFPENIEENRKKDFVEWSALNNTRIHWVNESSGAVSSKHLPKVRSEDIAFIQYTSGSTGMPKGVPLTHQNLLINIEQMMEAMHITESDVFVSWLPVHHDMGLILNTMAPLYAGGCLVLLAEGMHKVHSWLKAIEKYRGTFISAPDIAYRLCVKSIRIPADYDLSSLRVALNASEPIHLETYKLFEEAFKLHNIMISGYGLAEATIGVTMHLPAQPPRTDINGYVSSGLPLKGIDILIDSGEAPEDLFHTGEILVKSPALMKGYFEKKQLSGPFNENGYLHTGDIGYLDQDGYLYVLARKKNIIKHAGHTLYPDDVEQVVNSVNGVRLSAATGIETPPGSGESLYVFAESLSQEPASDNFCHNIAVNIVQKVYEHFGLRPKRVFIVKSKTLSFTPNGKLQHNLLKERYLNDFQQLQERILYPPVRQL